MALKRLRTPWASIFGPFPPVRLCLTLSVSFSEAVDAWVPLRVLWHLLLVEFLSSSSDLEQGLVHPRDIVSNKLERHSAQPEPTARISEL